jgi:hypothetical protein
VRIQEKQQVYDDYIKEFQGRERIVDSYKEVKLFDLRQFSEVWNVLFPYHVHRSWCDIPGHCKTCGDIEEIRNSSTNIMIQQAAKEAHHMHRSGLFMPERLSYKERTFQAIFQEQAPKETVLSIIIDTMDTYKNGVPKEGSNMFSKPIYQHLVGCKVHGHGVNFYSTYGTVQAKSPDLIIYIISREIDKFVARNNGRRPEKIFIQVDGGGENANQYVLAFLELLVIKRVARLILLTRLPVGHTHEV